MTQKQIEQAAREYADDTLGVGNSGHYLYAPLKDGFIAGSESRQAEIDELYDALNAMYDVSADGGNCKEAIYNAQQILKKHSK